MKGCARILAGIALLLFVISAALTIMVLNVRLFLLAPETYSEAFRQEGVYQELPALAADQMLFSMTYNPCQEDPSRCEGEGPSEQPESLEGGLPGYFANLPEQSWETVISALVDPLWLEEQTEAVLAQIFGLYTGEGIPDSIVISLQEIKDRVDSDAGYNAILEVMQAQPDCTLEQVAELTQVLITRGLSDAIIRCNPPAELMAQAEPFIRSGVAVVVQDLPANVEIALPSQLLNPEGPVGLGLNLVRSALQYAPWVSLFWLVLITVLVVRDIRGWLGWWGSGLVLTGLTTIGAGLALRPLSVWGMERVLQLQQGGGLSPGLVNTGLRVATNITNGFSSRIMVTSAIVLGLGLLMLVARYFFKDQSKRQIGAPLPQPRSEF